MFLTAIAGPKDAKNYRSIIGLLLYLSRDRVDIMYSVKELSSFMVAPTLCSVQRLRKLIGYLKSSGDIGIKLDWPEHGAGKWKKGTEAFWLLEGFTDADWCGNKSREFWLFPPVGASQAREFSLFPRGGFPS